jgi:hypothetical protein
MARRPLSELDTERALDDHTGGSYARRVRRRPVRALFLLVAALVAGGAMLTQAGASGTSDDPLANTVRGAAGAPNIGPSRGGRLNANYVDLAAAPSGRGYWAVAADGGVFASGRTHFHGSAASYDLAKPIVGIAPTRSGRGYWLAASDGGVFAFGDARFHGSAAPFHLSAPIVGIAASKTGNGYWLAAADGGVFAFGDAPFRGSATSIALTSQIMAISSTRTGRGYYLVAADGGVFAFGDARFVGAARDGAHIATDIAVSNRGRGYSVLRSDGGVVGFGGALSIRAPRDANANRHPAIAFAMRRGRGVWIARGYSPPPAAAASDLSQDPFLKCTRAHESDAAGGYRAVSPGGTYRGAYQFLRSTWNNIARAAGRPDLVGVDPAAAAPADQDQLALYLYHAQGAGPWGGRCAGLP